ncbi:MAG: RNase adapter RapZ [Acidobacteriota bacterium]
MSAAASRSEKPSLVLITGLSGSGKSTVAKCFEDLGYHTVDNLPLPLLRQFLEQPLELVGGKERIAVVTDVRAPHFAEELPKLFRGIDGGRIERTLLFLEASDESLVRRFSETRRPHPLAGDRPLGEGIARERDLLQEIRGMADMILDTSEWSIHEIRNQIFREFSDRPGEGPAPVVSLVSFGFKHGTPYGADLLFDIRFLPNPHFVPGLRELTGEDPPVREYLDSQDEYGATLERLVELLRFLLPRYRRENRSYVTIAVGCTGGRHRSVAMVEDLERLLAEADWSVRRVHRDLGQ